jgi:benzoyl-CoA reductase subunit C
MTSLVTPNKTSDEQRIFPITDSMSFNEVIELAKDMIEDLSFKQHKEWCIKTGSSIIGTFPVYVPKELISAFDMIPVSLQGGGEFLEITNAEAYLGSFICSISKSTLELGLIGNIGDFKGFISPYICDVARNLAGVFERNFPSISSHMLHYPQNFGSKGAIPFLIAEYKRIIKKFEFVSKQKFNPTKLKSQIKISNQTQLLLNNLLEYRNANPGCIQLDELYVILRLGSLLPNSEFKDIISFTLSKIKTHDKRRRDYIPVLVMGPFCEQPTLEIIQLIEDVGFFVVDFDFQVGQRFLTKPIPDDIDPLEALAQSYVKSAFQLPTRHNPKGREDEIITRLQNCGAETVIFLTAKFCEPALEDFVLYKEALEKSSKQIPYLQIEYEERSSNFEEVRLQLETLFESILFD